MSDCCDRSPEQHDGDCADVWERQYGIEVEKRKTVESKLASQEATIKELEGKVLLAKRAAEGSQPSLDVYYIGLFQEQMGLRKAAEVKLANSEKLKERWMREHKAKHDQWFAAEQNAAALAANGEKKDKALSALIGTHREPCAKPADCPAVRDGKAALYLPDDAAEILSAYRLSVLKKWALKQCPYCRKGLERVSVGDGSCWHLKANGPYDERCGSNQFWAAYDYEATRGVAKIQ